MRRSVWRWWCRSIEKVEGFVCSVEGLEVEAAFGTFLEMVLAADYGFGLLVVL